MQTQSHHRRPGILPGRRFAVAAAVACVAVACVAARPASAAADQPVADQPVVSATIFPGAPGSATSAQVMLSTLSTCDNYAGPSSITMQSASGPQPPQPVSAPAWTVGTVLTCGLQIPANDVTAVQVVNFSGAYETPLSAAEIFDPGQYPGSDGALPTIYRDGDENQITYVRPPLSAADPNAADNVVQQGDPVSLIVYENQIPLVVTATQSPVAARQGATEQVTLGASVTTADGTAVPSSALTFSWTVDNAQPLSGPAPVATVPSGVTPVTVQVFDPATGTGGTATFDVTYNPQPGSPTTTKPTGAGTHPNGRSTGTTKLTGGAGLDQAGSGNSARTGQTRPHSSTSTHAGTTGPPARSNPASGSASGSPPPASSPAPTAASALPAPTTVQTTTTTTTTTTTPATTPGLTADNAPAKAPPHRRSHAPKRRVAARPRASERLVTGRLVADVQALPVGASPLAHPIAAQATAPALVHAAGDSLSAPTWAYGVMAVVALLGAGALCERRGRRGRRLDR